MVSNHMANAIATSGAPNPALASASQSPTGVSVVIPAYNEVQAIAGVLRTLLTRLREIERSDSVRFEVIVVDDGSSDGTQQAAESVGDDVRVIRQYPNRGYGAALKLGIRHSKHEWILITDADGTYPHEHFVDLLALRDRADMVVGSRTGATVHIPLLRRPAKWTLTKLASYLSQSRIPDLNSGMRLIRRRIVEENIRILPNKFSFTTTITLAALAAGYAVEYVPINYLVRTGKSKIRPIADTIGFTTLILRTVLFFDPLRVFIPIALAFVLAGLVVLLGSLWLFERVMDVTAILLFVTGVQLLAIGVIADTINRRLGP